MDHHVTDDLDRRLRAARPSSARPNEGAFDAELLARVRTQPIAARRSVPRAVALPVAAGVTLTATAVVMLGGGPGDVGGPPSAAAITQTLRWLDPPSGTVLHVRALATQDGRTTVHETWQSADHPDQQRELTDGPGSLEVAGDAFYDPATGTIYDPPTETAPPAGQGPATPQKEARSGDGKPGADRPGPTIVADPVVQKVRTLLEQGQMSVTGRELHDGADTWAISLKPGSGRPSWTLWVSAADGRPLELRDPGRDANEAPQVVRWPTYEFVPAAQGAAQVTLTGAHPDAHVVHDPRAVDAAQRRLWADKG
jgi:hypothetical protein